VAVLIDTTAVAANGVGVTLTPGADVVVQVAMPEVSGTDKRSVTLYGKADNAAPFEVIRGGYFRDPGRNGYFITMKAPLVLQARVANNVVDENGDPTRVQAWVTA